MRACIHTNLMWVSRLGCAVLCFTVLPRFCFLCYAAGVDKVAFTGSVATGSRIMGLCASSVRDVSLELGGKSPAIVFPDADLRKALEWCVVAAT